MDAPKLPQQVSPDGRELWDWAVKFAAYTQRVDRVRQLRGDVAILGTRCGDCDKWMKSSQCPREINVNGRTRGPSRADRKCPQFIETREAGKRREELRAAIAAETLKE